MITRPIMASLIHLIDQIEPPQGTGASINKMVHVPIAGLFSYAKKKSSLCGRICHTVKCRLATQCPG